MKKVLLFISASFLFYQTQAQDTVKVKTNASPEQEAESLYNTGLEQMSQQKYMAAIEAFSKAITLNPSFEKAIISRGFSKHENKNNASAIEDFNLANSLKPSADAYFGKAQSFYSIGLKDSINKNLDKALALDNKYAKAFYLRAQLKFEDKQYPEAIADYNQAIAAKPDYAYAYNDRASAKKMLNDEAGAIADYQKAVELDSKLFFAYNNLGSAKRNKGDNDGAIDAYNKAIALKSDYYLALNNRGVAKLNKNDISGAISDFNTALRIKSDYVSAMNNMAAAYIKKQDYKAASDWCNKALIVDENVGAIYVNRGITKQMQKDEEGACADWKKAASLGAATGKNYAAGLCD
ncbi:MAG: tetratricopeptide repeat protein [Bacteroidetes bacterium]|nr:tetratricopeptide repeat protein [Bacteroidota bacterium]